MRVFMTQLMYSIVEKTDHYLDQNVFHVLEMILLTWNTWWGTENSHGSLFSFWKKIWNIRGSPGLSSDISFGKNQAAI